MSQPLVVTEAAEPSVMRITLNRPEKRNALSVALMDELRDAVRVATGDPRCRVLILSGNGPAFCAGLDLQEVSIAGGPERSARALAGVYEAICLAPQATIAAAHGAAVGGGVGFLAACDFVVAADDLRIGFPEVRRGLVAALVTALLRRQLPDRLLRELLLLGQTITASDALRQGLVNRVVSADRLADETQRLSGQVLQGAPVAIARTKSLLDTLAPRPIATDLVHALRYHIEARDDSEAAEGIVAFFEKREPRWASRLRPPK